MSQVNIIEVKHEEKLNGFNFPFKINCCIVCGMAQNIIIIIYIRKLKL